jgi:WASH complex subunit strumpellin
LEELSEGVFVQLTIESVLMDVEGKQLMTEALYLYGVMLLLLEHRVPGPTRERMVVSYFRYRGAAAVQNVDDVAKLVRSTGFVPGGPRPPNYPEQMFERVKMPAAVVDLIIGRLRSDDIYNRSQAFPAPQHRSTALATQSAMLYVILYFAPELLTGKPAVMREIVDKHFQDNWVVPYYMGYTVDLSEVWALYKAASTALNNVLERSNVEEVMARHRKAIEELAVENGKLLTKGVLVEEFVLDNLRKLLSHARQCNVTLRWWILHRTTVHKKFREAILRGADEASILMLLLNTAQFEFVLKEMFRELLEKKEARWNEAKREASGRMVELSEYFSGTKALTRVTKNEKLQKWFKQLGDDINALEFANTTLAGRKIQSISQALEEVQEFHQIAESLQVKSFLEDTRLFLTSMIRIVNVRSMLLADIDIISDLSYAFLLLDTYTPLVHNRIRADPSIVLLLRATFLKLSSLLSLPLVRITQAGSKDDVSVAEYYSSALVRYVRQVLDVVPLSVFAVLDQITKLQTQSLQPVPTKLERTLLKDHAQLRERYMLAQFTHQISVFTEGVLAMKTTLVGIIKLDPKQILEDGVLKQLVHQICSAMNEMLVFRTGKLEEFEQRLQQLGTMLSGIRSSFEYIQDYINVYGLRIWQQELSRIINYFVEQESNGFLKKKVYDWQSQFQSDAIPIPRFPALQEKRNNQHLSENFIGRLVREMLAQTDPRTTVYVDATQSWNANNSTREVAGIRTFDMLNRCVGVFGLTGIDKLVCFMIVRDLQSFVRTYRSRVDQNLRKFLHSITNALNPTTQFPPEPKKLYQSAVGKFQDLWPFFLEPVVRIGQMQLMRRQIANECNSEFGI